MPRVLSSTADASPHSGRAIQCVFCHRSFSRLEHRRRHERIHTKEKPYCCQECPRSFARKDLLIRHERFSHAHVAGERQKMAQLTGLNRPQQIKNIRRRMPEAAYFESAAESLMGETAGHDRGEDEAPPLLTSNPVSGLSSTSITTGSCRSQGPAQDYDLSIGTLPMGEGADMDINFSNSFDDFGSVFGNFNMPLFYYPTTFHTGPPLPYFLSGQTLDDTGLSHASSNQGDATRYLDALDKDPRSLNSLSRFESQLPSIHPESVPTSMSHRLTKSHLLCDVTVEDRQQLLTKVESFNSVIPAGFVLPSRDTLSRYLAGYANGFHDHLPFLHISTIEVKHASPELILAIAAVGGKYCFEDVKAGELFTVSKAVALERMRRREALKSASLNRKKAQHTSSGSRPTAAQENPEDMMRESDDPATAYASIHCFKSIETSQTLLLLMAMATWSGNKVMYREALAIQSILATTIREDGLLNSECVAASSSWENWIRFEGAKRTYFMIYCFFNFHSIIYNTAPAILNTELGMDLPCSETEWKCSTAAAWEDIHRLSTPEPTFREYFRNLCIDNGSISSSWQCSSLGSYVLIHALIQQIFLAREVTKCRSGSEGSLSPQDMSALQQALTNWQYGWEENPESSLDPKNPHGPISFNSSALLRIAYIRLHADIGPWRALETQDPQRIATAMLHSSDVRRSSSLTQAALHSAYALSIPIRLGVNLISRHQIFTWSLQHSVGSLECALLLSKWLDAVTRQSPEGQAPDEDEQRLLDFVANLLTESDSDKPSMINSAQGSKEGGGCKSSHTRLSARVMKVWAKIFCGERVWAIVNVIGKSMYAYGDMLEKGTP